ncbi:DUF2125 domain-containing protein [Xanthobacter dioxanivorans]|uniref:DUF2125 domain-containing protein n=1 Tax=Xanthobacter dioxanivorans TaxID=2528964 RepID=A0A974PSG9_9HYPH|nr:DUF2125 domain-containing protein [Xanthobacter dioxanivorans]QRG08300.1 DUF2125 domain-containing protein [Xanthobacter dioxanivorans]
MTALDAPPSRPKPWLVIVPLALLVTLGVVWTGLWFYAANRAEREIDAWIGREARLGRIWNCGERTLAGFPFRFELRCVKPTLETRGGDALRFTAATVHAVAQVWAPNHIVAEFAAPARVEDLNSGVVYAATWSLVQMSGVGDLSGRPQRFSLQAHDLRLEQPGSSFSGSTPLLAARLFEFHARRTPDVEGRPDGVDYASGLLGGESALLSNFGVAGPVDMTLQGTVTASADLRPMPVAQRLRAWAEAGGLARLDRFAVTAPAIAITAAGILSLDPQGRLNGKLDLGFAGLNDLVQGLDKAGAIPREVAPIVRALAMVGKPGTVEGRKGATFALGFEAGTLKLGGFPVGIVPRLF